MGKELRMAELPKMTVMRHQRHWRERRADPVAMDFISSSCRLLDSGDSSEPLQGWSGFGLHITELTFVECLLWARHCPRPFTFIKLFHLLNTYEEGLLFFHLTNKHTQAKRR